MPSLINIEVTPDIAQKIRLMAESGLFAIKTGNAQCNFSNGELKSVKTEIITYAQKEIDNLSIPIILEKSA